MLCRVDCTYVCMYKSSKQLIDRLLLSYIESELKRTIIIKCDCTFYTLFTLPPINKLSVYCAGEMRARDSSLSLSLSFRILPLARGATTTKYVYISRDIVIISRASERARASESVCVCVHVFVELAIYKTSQPVSKWTIEWTCMCVCVFVVSFSWSVGSGVCMCVLSISIEFCLHFGCVCMCILVFCNHLTNVSLPPSLSHCVRSIGCLATFFFSF